MELGPEGRLLRDSSVEGLGVAVDGADREATQPESHG